MREKITDEEVIVTFNKVREKTFKKIIEKGDHAFSSSHEILGILEEEMHELREAVRSGDKDELSSELLDICVGALFGLVSVDNNKTEWL